jgi:hypothetical protein
MEKNKYTSLPLFAQAGQTGHGYTFKPLTPNKLNWLELGTREMLSSLVSRMGSLGIK